MKKILVILFLLIQASVYSQAVWVVWGDSLFIKRGADSVYYDEYMFFDNIIRLKISKQNTLVSGTNIKTINSTSILGSGDIVIGGSASFSSITGAYTDNSSLVTGFGLKQNTITTGTASQYFKGDLSLATFPTTTAAFTSSTNKNFVTDAQATVIGNTSGTNSGDNSANTTYANDFRTANFVAGTNYLAPNGSAASLTSIPVNQATGALPFANGGNTGSAATSATTGAMTVSMTTAVITITPTGACTFNATGGVVGQQVTFIITTSGVSSFVLTWGTNFRKTGTLATGTVSARFFAVSFVCVNGTIWQEISRTIVQT